MRVDEILDRLRRARGPREREDAIDEIVEKGQENPLFLSEMLIKHAECEPVLNRLRQDEAHRYEYFIKFDCDEWGNKYYPGDKVRRRFKKSLKREGTPILSRELNEWKALGQYDKKRYTYKDYTVDQKGCIKCNVIDAEYFLTQFGTHPVTNHRISYHAKATSPEPATAPDGQKLHVHYWRAKEQTREMYEKLPKLEKRPKEEKKRGLND